MKKLYVFALLFLFAGKSFSQFAYTVANSTIVAGTYTDLGTNGTAITTNAEGGTMTYDDDKSGVLPIGFNFSYNGATWSNFILHSNGFIKLANTIVDTPAAATYNMLTAPDANLIYPFGGDLDGGATSEYRYQTTGTAGSRVLTVQFKNVKDWSATTGQYTSVNFQVKLYETTNVIEFVYGTFTASTTAPAFIAGFAGIKGTDQTSSINATKASLTAWTSATFLSGPYTGNQFNHRNNVLPTPGFTFRFTPIALPNNDVEVSQLLTLGKLPQVYGTPHNVRVVLKNAGANAISNLTVSLNISGANTFTSNRTITSFPVGKIDTISFDAFTPSNLGDNVITVSVPADDVNTNNSLTWTQTVTSNIFSYAANAPRDGQVGYNTGAGLILNKYTVNAQAQVSSVNVMIGGGQAVLGNQVYAVVVNSAGTILAKSDSIFITSADTSAYKSFAFTVPPTIDANQDFYVGLAQKANTVTGYFPVGYQLEGPPIKSGRYYVAPIAGGVAPTMNNTVGRFMIEAVMAGAVPLDMLSFTGNLRENTVVLSWKTANEINTRNFEVQRSSNGVNFETIGTVRSVNNPSTINNYGFNDNNPFSSRVKVLYYRLKQVDNDGRYKYTTAIRVKLATDVVSAISSIYPNPASKQVNVVISAPESNQANLVITDMGGKILAQRSVLLLEGVNNQRMDIQNLPSGKYFIKVLCASGCEHSVAQFVKQ